MAALPPPLASLERRLGLDEGSLAGPEKARAEAALDDAVALVLAEVPANIAARWEAEGAPRVVETVVLKAARREYENPQGLRAEEVGEYRAETETATGAYLTPSEVALVRRTATGRPGGFVGTVRTPSAYGTEP